MRISAVLDSQVVNYSRYLDSVSARCSAPTSSSFAGNGTITVQLRFDPDSLFTGGTLTCRPASGKIVSTELGGVANTCTTSVRIT